MSEFEYTITDQLGIHARPAGILVSEAKKFSSSIAISSGGQTADAKRIFALMGLGVKCGQTVRVICEGKDEEEAAAAMKQMLEQNF